MGQGYATVVRRGAALLCVSLLAAAAAMPGFALAASPPTLGGVANGTTSPFTPGLPTPTPSVPTTTATPTITGTTSTSSDTGLSGTSAIAIALGAIVLLAGISFFIWRDARKRAPIRRAAAAAAGADGRTRAGSKARPKPRKLSQAERKRRKRGRAR